MAFVQEIDRDELVSRLEFYIGGVDATSTVTVHYKDTSVFQIGLTTMQSVSPTFYNGQRITDKYALGYYTDSDSVFPSLTQYYSSSLEEKVFLKSYDTDIIYMQT